METVESSPGGELSAEVHLKRRLVSARLWAAEHRLWTHPRIADLYPEILFRMHCMARASVPLMEAARDRLRPAAPRDRVAAGVVDYLDELIAGEQEHDDWILEDLEALGLPREEVLARVPPPTVAALVGAQYYWIFHHHPVALLGFIAVVEADPPTVDRIESIMQRTGLPRDACRHFLRHAVLEPAHNRLLEKTLDSLPFTAEHRNAIGVNVLGTLSMLAQSAEEILELQRIKSL